MQYYREWPLMDSLPAGWKFAKSAGSPLAGYEFAISDSPLRGGKTALVRVREPQVALPLSEPCGASTDEERPVGAQDAKPPCGHFYYDASQARTVNELARQKFKHRLLADILIDLTICEIEGWCKHEYIDELRRLITSIGKQTCIDAQHQVAPKTKGDGNDG